MTKKFSGLCGLLKGYTNLKLFFSEMKVTPYPPQSVYWGRNKYFPPGKIMHQSIPAAPSPPPPPTGAAPRALVFFWPWMANSWGRGLLSCQIPQGGDEKRQQMPHPPSTLQHFSLIAQSNSAVLNISMCDFLFQVTSSFVIALVF